MFVQVPEVHLQKVAAPYVHVAVTGYFNTDLRDVIFLGQPAPAASVVQMARAFTSALVDDSRDEPVDFLTPGDLFGS